MDSKEQKEKQDKLIKLSVCCSFAQARRIICFGLYEKVVYKALKSKDKPDNRES